MHIVIDIETTGIVWRCKQTDRYPRYRDLCAYESARIISISWQVLSANYDVLEVAHHYVKPSGFEKMPEEAEKVHGITTEDVMTNGKPFHVAATQLYDHLKRHECSIVVGHNIPFDACIICSELCRINHTDAYKIFSRLTRVCTMLEAKHYFRLNKYPKLTDLYERLFNEPMANAHSSDADVDATAKCYIVLQQLKATRAAEFRTVKHQT